MAANVASAAWAAFDTSGPATSTLNDTHCTPSLGGRQRLPKAINGAARVTAETQNDLVPVAVPCPSCACTPTRDSGLPATRS
jgi:hypothetical protein